MKCSTGPKPNTPARQAALGSSLPGSSAGGEQPKFSAVRQGRAVLVKFSPAGDSPADQRWRDLLLCEALALHTLAEAGIAAAPTEIVQAGGRVFLQSQRFDRTAKAASAWSRSMCTTASTSARAPTGSTPPSASTAPAPTASARPMWKPCACSMPSAPSSPTPTATTATSRCCCRPNDRWQLAPAYDMLPMLYAPVAGEIVPRDFAAQPPRPSVHTLHVWPRARELALRFWQTTAQDPRISAPFRELAQANERLLAGL